MVTVELAVLSLVVEAANSRIDGCGSIVCSRSFVSVADGLGEL